MNKLKSWAKSGLYETVSSEDDAKRQELYHDELDEIGNMQVTTPILAKLPMPPSSPGNTNGHKRKDTIDLNSPISPEVDELYVIQPNYHRISDAMTPQGPPINDDEPAVSDVSAGGATNVTESVITQPFVSVIV